ncbi:MAG: Nif3-like dinuclear metal center hexameric protein [Spirochaetaceae bacterium]
MNFKELDSYFRSFLPFEEFARIDPSKNGIQVERSETAITRVAFAVDAALEPFEAASEWGAQALVVHHGLFWGHEQTVTGTHYRRLKFLLEHDMGLYACHLPLDARLEVGNNAVMAEALGLREVEPFGEYKGLTIGVKGELPKPLSPEEVAVALFGSAEVPLRILPFGKEKVRRVGLISGGAPREAMSAVAEGLDLFVTGDAAHTVYHDCRESGINVMFAGHYATETWGVWKLSQRVRQEKGVETRFIDIPTGL